MKFNLYILILITALISLSRSDRSNDRLATGTPVLFINGEAVQQGEFLIVARQLKSDVINFFACQIKKKDSFDEEEFWNSSLDGIQPFNKLKEETMKQLIRIRIEQSLAAKYLKIEKFNYIDFISKLDVENKRRLDAIKNNMPVYGPVQYSADYYYRYLYNNMVIKLKDFLGREVFKFSDERCKNYYENNKDVQFRTYEIKRRLSEEEERFSDYESSDEVIDQIRLKLIDEGYESLIHSIILTTEAIETDNIMYKTLTLSTM